MPLDFPNTPTVGQVFGSWQWDGIKWIAFGAGYPATYQPGAGLSISGATAPPTIQWSGTYNLNAAAAPVPAILPLLELVAADTHQADLDLFSFGVNPNGSVLLFHQARGTGATPTAVQVGDALGAIGGYGYTSAASYAGPTWSIVANATDNYSGANQGSTIAFSTTATGASTMLQRMLLQQGLVINGAGGLAPSGGDMGPGTVNVRSGLYVNGVLTGGTGSFVPTGGGTMTGGLIINFNAMLLPAGPAGTTLLTGGLDGQLNIQVMAAFANYNALAFTRADGTNAAKTAIVNTDVIGNINWDGYNGSAYVIGAQISGLASGNWSLGGYPTALQFSTVAIGSTTLSNRMQLGVGLYIGAPIGYQDPGQGSLNLNQNNSAPPNATAGPAQLKLVGQDANPADLELFAAGAGGGCTIAGHTSQGTVGAPTASVSGNGFLTLGGWGYTGSAYAQAAAFVCAASENWSSGHQGGSCLFYATPAGSTTLALKMRLDAGLSLGTFSADPGFGSVTLNANAAALPATTANLRVGGVDGSSTGVEIDAFGTGVAPTLNFVFSGGTAAARTAVANSGYLAVIQFQGYDGSAVATGAQIYSTPVSTNWTTSDHSSQMLFTTTAVGSTTLTTRMLLRQGLTIGAFGTDPGVGGLVLNANAAAVTPTGNLYIAGVDAGAPQATIDCWGVGYSRLVLRNAAGTAAAPTATQSNSVLGTLSMRGRGATGYSGDNGMIAARATQNWTDAAQGTQLEFYTTAIGAAANAQNMLLDGSGNLTIQGATATKPGGGSWTAPSDRALKSSVTDWNTGLAEILRLRPVSYQYNNDDWNLEHTDYVGLDAEDGAAVIPEMGRTVTVLAGPPPAEGEARPATEAAALDHGPLLFALVNAVKQLSERLERLEA